MKAHMLRAAAVPAGALLFIAAAPASADMFDGAQPYWSVGGGAVFYDLESDAGEVDTETGWEASGAVGWAFETGLRAEIEGGWSEADLDGIDGDVSVGRAMANLYYDFTEWGAERVAIRPYIGVGIGGAWVDVDAGIADGDDFVFAAQGLAGLSFNLTDRSSLALGYRYYWADDVEIDGGASIEPESHSITLALRFGF